MLREEVFIKKQLTVHIAKTPFLGVILVKKC